MANLAYAHGVSLTESAETPSLLPVQHIVRALALLEARLTPYRARN